MSDDRYSLAWGVRDGRLFFILSTIDPDARTITENYIDPMIGEPYAGRIVAELNRMTQPRRRKGER